MGLDPLYGLCSRGRPRHTLVQPCLASSLRAWQAGDFSDSPDLAWLDDAALGGARGAHSEQGLIALNATWAAQATLPELEAVFAEELGHWLDADSTAAIALVMRVLALLKLYLALKPLT